MDQLDLIDIYRTFHPKTMNFTFFSSAHGTLCQIDHILGHKSSLGKFKKIEIIPSILSGHNAIRLDVNYRRKVMLKILQARLQQYVNGELSDVQAGFRKGKGTRPNCQHLLDHQKSKRVPEKHLPLLY